jgi:hypothetical protein
MVDGTPVGLLSHLEISPLFSTSLFHHLLISNYVAVNDLMKSGTVFDEKWDLYSTGA